MSNADDSLPRPARDYAEAELRFAELAARDTAAISSAGRSRFFRHGRRTARAVVLLHGFTNCPQQWVPFARLLHAAGDGVVIPRLPGHGYFDRATPQASRPSRATLLRTVHAAVDVACGAGDAVTVMGLSVGGTLGPRVAQQRDDVAHTIALVPFFAVKRFDAAATGKLATVLGVAPDARIPWDPFGDGSQIPSYGYPKFSSRMLGRFLAIGGAVAAGAAHGLPATGRVTFVLNAREPACDNRVTRHVAETLERARPGASALVEWTDLPANHDIIDPTNPHERIALVYPRIAALVGA